MSAVEGAVGAGFWTMGGAWESLGACTRPLFPACCGACTRPLFPAWTGAWTMELELARSGFCARTPASTKEPSPRTSRPSTTIMATMARLLEAAVGKAVCPVGDREPDGWKEDGADWTGVPQRRQNWD